MRPFRCLLGQHVEKLTGRLWRDDRRFIVEAIDCRRCGRQVATWVRHEGEFDPLTVKAFRRHGMWPA